MAMGDVGVWMRLAPTSAINEIPSTSYVQDRADALGPRSKRSSLSVGEASVRNSGYGGNAYVWSRGLSGKLHAQEGVGLQIRSPWQSAVGIYRHRRRFQTVSGLKEGEGLCKWGTLGTGAAVFHSIEQSGLYTPINKERNPLLGVLTLIYGDGGSGGGNHGSGGGGGGSGNEEESFQNTNGRQILAGLVSLLSLLFGTRRCLRSWILCLSAASVGFLLSSWSQLGGVALALTATSFSKPRRLADGTSGSENGDEVSGVQSGKDLEGAIWEVKGSKWQRYILDVENDGFVPDVLKQNEVDAEAYELSCQEEKGQELARSEVDREYATVRSRLTEQVKNWESEGIEDSRKTEEIGGVDSLAARNLNLNPQINHGRERAVSQLDEDGARMEQAQPNKEAASTIQIQLQSALDRFGEVMKQVMLPEGYPRSVTDDYTEFTMWRMGQIIASQISGVLTTQALLYAVGLGKGAIPTAAAINWVLRDGIGYLSKIMLSKYGRHFDVHPKGWRVLSDLLENASYGLELLTPVFPHLFVYLGAVAGAGRSAAGMIQAATKSCFNAGFAAQRNFAEVVAKGEAQGMVSKSIGIALGIAVSSYVGSSGPQLLATFAVVTGLHMFFNLKSYQAVQLRTLNTYRASLVLSEYLRSGTVPSVREVNAEEPIVPRIGFFHLRLRGQQEGLNTLSEGSKQAAESIDQHLELGSTFGSVIHTREEADALLPLYEQEQYILAQRGDRLLVVLKESVTPRDMLRALFQVTIMRNLSIMYPNLASYRTMVGDCRKGGILELSYNIMSEEFERMQQNLSMTGWVSEGLVARPSPNRLLDAPKEV